MSDKSKQLLFGSKQYYHRYEVSKILHVSEETIKRFCNKNAFGYIKDKSITHSGLLGFMDKNGIPHDIESQTVFTTGEAAKILQVSPAAVQILFDKGKFEGGYRINQDRRIPQSGLLEFMNKNGIPHDIESQTVFTTGEVAQILQVAPSAVQRLFDKEKFEGVYKIAKERRVLASGLLGFMDKNGIPYDIGYQTVFTTGEVAKILQVSQHAVVKLFSEGQFNGVYKINKDRRIPRTELEAYIRNEGILGKILPDEIEKQEDRAALEKWQRFLESNKAENVSASQNGGFTERIFSNKIRLLYIAQDKISEETQRDILGDNTAIFAHADEFLLTKVESSCPSKLVIINMNGHDVNWTKIQLEKAKKQSPDRRVIVIGDEEHKTEMIEAGADRYHTSLNSEFLATDVGFALKHKSDRGFSL